MAELGALETARAIADGKLTAVEACEAAIARIEALDGPINAVVVRDFARARADAKLADAAIAAGERKPLLGVPMTVKESFTLAWTPATWGFPEYKDDKAEADGSTVARLRAAGAVILGKTNVPVALADWQTVNPVYGRTVNPYDHSRTPGGSSGGAAAALATGMVPLELGSDIGGSIRAPAHFCGVYGHKPTYGVIPLDGHPFPGSDGADPALAVAGPMARHTEDLAAALDVVSETALPRASIASLKDARLFVLTTHPLAKVSREIVAGIDAVAEKAEKAGAILTYESDLLPDLKSIMNDYISMLNIALSNGETDRDGTSPTLTRWFELLNAQARNQRAWARFFGEFDAVLCPVYGATAFPHIEEPNMRKRTIEIDGEQTPFSAQFSWISMATFAGLPATSAPIGRDAKGLPFGIQVIAARLRDHDAIALAGLLTE